MSGTLPPSAASDLNRSRVAIIPLAAGVGLR